jgi:type IV pilus assembly protein PilY1
VGLGPRGAGMVILFGTGKFLEPGDKNAATISPQSFYGIIDTNTGTSTDIVTSRTLLTRQDILVEQSFTFGGRSVPLRVTSDNTLGVNRGWYLDLISPVNGREGEMQVSDSILRSERIIFTTTIPSGDPCEFGGQSWLMELDALSGARLTTSPFDRNNDGLFDLSDNITVTLPNGTTVTVPASAIKSEDGLWARPAVLSGATADYLYASSTRDCSGDPNCTNLDVTSTDPGVGAIGRQSWRQIR